MVVVVSIVLAAVFLIFIDPILTLFGATDALRDYAWNTAPSSAWACPL